MREYLEIIKAKKNIASLLVLLLLVISIPLGLNLLNSRLKLFSRAALGDPIELLAGRCIASVEDKKINCEEIPLKLISPLGPPAPSATCTPRPACLDANPACQIAVTPDMCPPPPAIPTPPPTPTPTPTGGSACTTTALSKTPTVLSNRAIQWTYTYPENSKIKSVSFPAKTGLTYEIVGGQAGSLGQALSVDFGNGVSSFTFKVQNENACSAFTAPFTMVNSCGTEMQDFVGAGSASAYGTFCP